MGEIKRELEIKSIVVTCHDASHRKTRWNFDPYEVFEILKNITESELAVRIAAPEEAIGKAIKIINRKYRTKSDIILTWRVSGLSKTQQTYIRVCRANIAFKNIDSEGNALASEKNLIRFDEMAALVPQVKGRSGEIC